ncbi:MAG TPA: TonB family protein [Solimonas sp.]
MRWFVTPIAALVVVLLLFLLMHSLVRAPDLPDDVQAPVEGIEVVKAPEEQEPDVEELLREAAPPPPPAAPPALARPDLPSVVVPIPVAAAPDASAIRVPVNVGAGLNLGTSGNFAGFAGRGGAGSGSGGYGSGKGFKGKPLIPLSTARPQMPEWACKQGLRGWVEVVFTVMPNGRVANVKLVDADPRGVFEAAAIESISHWIYESSDKAREVKQRVPMNPEDCAFNWQ